MTPAPFWVNLYLSKHECEFMGKLNKEDIARAKTLHGTFRFTDDLCALNDGGKFQKSYKKVYPKELALKLKHSGSHATFPDLNIIISNRKKSTKVYDKRDDFFLFFCLHAKLSWQHHIICFYGSMMSMILHIGRSSSSVISFYEKTSALITRMKKQGGNRRKLMKQIMKAYENHQFVFQNYDISNRDIMRTFP